MTKLLLIMIMMFTLGTSTVNAVEDTISIEDKISELAEVPSDNESTIKNTIDELSEDELKAVIVNVNKLEEKNLDDLAIEEAAISKLEEMNRVESLNPLNIWKPNPLIIGMGVLALILVHFAGIVAISGYSEESKYPLAIGVVLVLIVVINLL